MAKFTLSQTESQVAAFEKRLDEQVQRDGREPAADDAQKTADAKAMLEVIRKRADGWRTGVAGTFTLILASLAIKPGEGFMLYEGDVEVLLGALIGLAMLTSLAGLLLLIRAANGPSWLSELTGSNANASRYMRRVNGARHNLRQGQTLWAISIVLFTTAVVVTWFNDVPVV